MADTKIADLTVGTAASTDRWAIAISPFGSGDNRYLTHDLLGTYFALNTLAGGTITTSQPMTLTQTWNAAGVTFTGFKINMTSTASAATSIIADLQVGGTSQFKVDKSGLVTIPSSGKIVWNTRTTLQTDANGALFIRDSAGSTPTSLSALNFGIGMSYTATSFMSFAAGTTAKSQMNFASSTAPTSPVDGDLWFDGTNIKYRASGATKTITAI